MKIAYLIPDCGISGGVAVACQHTNRLLKRGHDIYLISQTQETQINWFPGLDVPIRNIDDIPQDLDVLIATGWNTSFNVLDLRARHKFYFVQSDETRFYPKESVWKNLAALSYLLKLNYITEAKWIQSWLEKNFHHKAKLVPNGIDQEIFYPDEPLFPKSKKPRILLEGAIGLPYKGMADAFAAVKNLDAEIWCVSSLGKPNPKWQCDKFFSRVPMNEMRHIYSSCDVLLKMSRVEGFFGPPLEMMACGGAVVVSEVTGYDEYIVDEYNALVVEPGDVKGAREAVQQIISNQTLKDRLIANGKATADQMNWESSIDILETHLGNVISETEGVEISSVREIANEALSSSFDLAKKQEIAQGRWEPSVLSEPLDRIYFHLRKSSILRSIANLIFRTYKKFR